MLVKLGVLSLDSLDRDRTLLGFPKRLALPLYGEIVSAHPQLDAFLPRILERHQTASGAFKRTADRRFVELDAAVSALVEAWRREHAGPLRVHDFGVSDGRSSAELFDRLRPHGPLAWTASDRDVRVDALTRGSDGVFVAFDEDGQPVQYGGHGFVISPVAPENAWVYPLNRLVLRWFERAVRPRAERARNEALRTPLGDLERRRVDGWEAFRVPLICRACHDRMKAGELAFERRDVCEPLPGEHDLLRALNLLNHLPPDDLRRAAAGLRGALAEGGLLVVGRSNDPGGETRATVWRREGDRLRVVHEQHGGSELASAFEG